MAAGPDLSPLMLLVVVVWLVVEDRELSRRGLPSFAPVVVVTVVVEVVADILFDRRRVEPLLLLLLLPKVVLPSEPMDEG